MISLDIGYVPKAQVESRDSLADRIIAARIARAEGTGVGIGDTAAVELAAGLWERAFVSADCESLSVEIRAMMARRLLLEGEFVAYYGFGQPIVPVHSWDIHGKGSHAGDWRYRLTMPQPDGSRTVRASSSRVIHVRIGCRTETPWRGVSPLANATLTRQVLEALESRMRDEALMPVGAVMPVPKPSDQLANDIAMLRGRVLVGETMAGGWGQGDVARAYRDWEARRVGADIPDANRQLRLDLQAAVLAAAGVPSELAGSVGAAAREAWRRFLHSTIAPIGRVVSAELMRVGLPDTITFDALFASDLQGRARAMGSMVQAGVKPDSAARICGFEDADIAPLERGDIAT